MKNEFINLCINNRKVLGLTSSDVSEILDVDINDYKEFEKGNYVFNELILKKIIKLYCIGKNDIKDYSHLYDLSDVDDEILDISKDIINSIEKGDFDAQGNAKLF